MVWCASKRGSVLASGLSLIGKKTARSADAMPAGGLLGRVVL